MTDETRRTRFEARIETERRFLTQVNEATGGNPPLAGMTENAVDRWRRDANQFVLSFDVGDVASILMEVSKRASLLADNSRDVFVPNGAMSTGSLDELEILLNQVLHYK